MKGKLRTAKRVLFFIVAILLLILAWYLSKAIPIGTGYAAKYLCSSTFISGRDPDVVFEEDVKPVNPLSHVINFQVNYEEKSVVAKALGIFKSKAVYVEPCGCVLLAKDTLPASISALAAFDKSEAPQLDADTPWPLGEGEPIDPESVGFDAEKLNAAIDAAFAEPSENRPRKTRAIVIIKDGQLIAERYAPGFNRDMPLLGWSMTKTVTNALVGILVHKGLLDIHQPADVPEWQSPDDPRRDITLDQLLRMSSGLKFQEIYQPLYDATDMLYGAENFAAFAAAKPLEVAPDEKWYYSSGTANIVARIVREKAEQLYENYYDFMRNELFYKIGMLSAVIEPDLSGTFVGSSYCFATPRDWARFGQLYLDDGVWNGNRIFPEGWVKYSTTPTPKAPLGEYGAFIWLNAGAADDPAKRLWPDAPRDAFAAQGYQEQKVIIVPSKRLVLVRFGATSERSAWSTNDFIKNVINAIEK